MGLKDFVSYETAKKLKAAGFDEPCNWYYSKERYSDGYYWPIETSSPIWYNKLPDIDFCSAPTLWQAQKWLREEKKLSVEPYANIVVNFNYSIADLTSFANKKGGGIAYDSYEAALSAGIDEALELITNKIE